ncbi:hypothetical protein [Mycobacteroides abscessus]|uniref:hypothetical protein n=1 Tax=Mycobacteroides abscessus TaxID=36809 RepID=UPI001877F99B|nr:hypothetical protein [Mycobacteroides abscessus]MDM2082844.1 hypothetical protein [Mycobacteroides abscessus]MDM2086018.1 hypothetical protein [Mycobacteroides abscessus]
MTDDELLPPIELMPPYSLDFIAHLHGGCYPRHTTEHLLLAVVADAHGAGLLQAVMRTTVELQLLGLSTSNSVCD